MPGRGPFPDACLPGQRVPLTCSTMAHTRAAPSADAAAALRGGLVALAGRRAHVLCHLHAPAAGRPLVRAPLTRKAKRSAPAHRLAVVGGRTRCIPAAHVAPPACHRVRDVWPPQGRDGQRVVPHLLRRPAQQHGRGGAHAQQRLHPAAHDHHEQRQRRAVDHLRRGEPPPPVVACAMPATAACDRHSSRAIWCGETAAARVP